jgi:hypothetical protein
MLEWVSLLSDPTWVKMLTIADFCVDDDEVHLFGAGLHSMECSLRIKKEGGTKTRTIEQ